MSGAFIVVEGADGVGKTTLAKRLASRIRSGGLDVLEVREPGGTPLAEAARRAVLDHSLDATPVAKLFLILAARADLVSRVIRPALESGTIVVGDRFDLSTRAYQIAGRDLPEDAVVRANQLATGGLTPDLTIVLEAPADALADRKAVHGAAPDRIESASDEERARVVRAFRDARGPGVVHVDASGAVAAVEEVAWAAVSQCLRSITRSTVT